LAEDHDGQGGIVGAQRDRRPQAIVGHAGRHADVGHDQVGVVRGDGVHQVSGVADRGDDVELEPGQDADEPLA